MCPIKSNSNTIELTVHTSCYCFLDLLCVSRAKIHSAKWSLLFNPKFTTMLILLLDLNIFFHLLVHQQSFLFS